MQITVFSLWMSVLWSSILIIIFYFLRKSTFLIDVCSVSGVIILYCFCIIRMSVPVELPWTKVLGGGELYNKIYRIYRLDFWGSNVQLGNVFIIIWIVGSVCFLYHTFKEYYNVIKYFGQLPGLKEGDVCDLIEKIGVNREYKASIVKTQKINIPCCVGIIDKRVFLPDKEYTNNELRYILLHEYSHMRSNDILIKLLINILCAVYWWNPVVYLLRKDLIQSLEIRCDGIVTRDFDKKEKSDYLETILKTFKNCENAGSPYVNNTLMVNIADIKKDRLFERFNFVARDKKVLSKYGIIVAWAIAGLLLICSYSFIIQPRYELPLTEIEEYNIMDNDDVYILKYEDGTYSIHLNDRIISIDKKTADNMIEGGTRVIEREE